MQNPRDLSAVLFVCLFFQEAESVISLLNEVNKQHTLERTQIVSLAQTIAIRELILTIYAGDVDGRQM